MIRQTDDYFSDILNQSSADALRTRRNSVTLLLEQYSDNTKIAAEPNSDPYFQLLKKEVDPDRQILLVYASGSLPDVTDPQLTLAVMLARAYEQGWRKFILYR